MNPAWIVWVGFVIAGGLGCFGSRVVAEEARTIYIVRHAEKREADHGDPDLSPAGKSRALALADLLAAVDLDYVFTSEYKRTIQTGELVVAALGVTASVVPARAEDELLRRLRELPAGSTALVVAHSNTAPRIARRLGVSDVNPMAESEYDRLMQVTIDPVGVAVLRTLRFGPSDEE